MQILSILLAVVDKFIRENDLNNLDQEYPTYPMMRGNSLRVLHITDLHLDPEYAPGSEANCSSELCCHKQSDTSGNFKH